MSLYGKIGRYPCYMIKALITGNPIGSVPIVGVIA